MTQRQIKFRAWVDRLKQMSYSPDAVSDNLNDALKDWGTDLMQFTGLKDKNGKEIYEGDVLRVDGWKEPQQAIWHSWGAWHLSGGAYELGFFNPHICMVVIGNVYENGDLVK